MKNTGIQWADGTINPVMGCGGCELYRPPAEVIAMIEARLQAIGIKIQIRPIVFELIYAHYSALRIRGKGHSSAVTSTNVWHHRNCLAAKVIGLHGKKAGKTVIEAIKAALPCYAAKLHLNRGFSIVSPDRKPNKGYAPTFEQVTTYAGRMAEAASWSDLAGMKRLDAQWKDGCPRLIFVSDMGDAFSAKGHFPFLEREVKDSIVTTKGRRHLWLWLTKRPHHMREFAERIGGFPANVCAMTTVTGPDALDRVDKLRAVKASCRGLSIEPLWGRLPAKDLDLAGIDWVIVGGESGSGKDTRPFHVEWAEEIRDHCRKNGVAFFLKQLGRNPMKSGKLFRLKHPHGGDWNEWDPALRVREFPPSFRRSPQQRGRG